MTINIEDRDFAEHVLGSETTVLVAFRADWCEASQQLAPVLDEIAAAYDGRVKVVNVELGGQDPRSNRVCRRFSINRLPAVMLFNEGRRKDLMGGLPSATDIKDMIDRQLQPVLDVGEHNFQQEVLDSQVPVLVHFHSRQCEQSQILIPVIDSMAERFVGRAKVVRVEADAFNAGLCARYGAVRFPMLGVFQDQEMKDFILGAGSDEIRDERGTVRRGGDYIAEMVERFVM
jgi:thioredoxin 1